MNTFLPFLIICEQNEKKVKYSDGLFRLTHMSEEHIIFGTSRVSLLRQHHLTRRPGVCKVEELPLILVALVGLQVLLPPIQGAAGHRFLRDTGRSVLHYSFLFFHVSFCRHFMMACLN